MFVCLLFVLIKLMFLLQYGRILFIRFGMISMIISCILVGLPIPFIYYMLPSLFLFGLSNPLIHTPLMPEMGAIVKEMVTSICCIILETYL